jgi:CRP/FNR family cyclic AMP-dependent transcriptional regulator
MLRLTQKHKHTPASKKSSRPGSADVDRGSALTDHSEYDLFKGISLFSSLGDRELHQIRNHIVLRDFKRNQILLHEEETSDFMYIIMTGKVKVCRVGKDGKETIFSMHGAGEFYGELALIDGKTAPASVIAIEHSRVAIISKEHFFSLLYTQQKIMENLLKILCARLRESWQKIEMLNFNDASQRLKMLLNMIAESNGEKTPEGTVLRVKMIHQDMADMTGLTRETVTRVIDRWKKSGEIEVLRSKYIRLNPEFSSIEL